ncbi:MAG TPA: hypothetical protein VF177_04750 [Anaerolineae bacterium]
MFHNHPAARPRAGSKSFFSALSLKSGGFSQYRPVVICAFLALALLLGASTVNSSDVQAYNAVASNAGLWQQRAPRYTGIPTFRIVSVAADKSVTIETNNFPANQTFAVTMGLMGTRGIGGTVVGTIESGSGGTLTRTFDIPAGLHGLRQISIRAQTAHARPYFAYNWFYNNTTGDTGGPGDGATPPPPTTGYRGIPTFKVCSVTRDTSVTIVTNNFPANQTFTVTMGPMGSRGIGGTVVGTITSGGGGTLTQTFNIPAHLQGASRISIRAQTAHARPYFAYNWFYNNTATVC